MLFEPRAKFDFLNLLYQPGLNEAALSLVKVWVLQIFGQANLVHVGTANSLQTAITIENLGSTFFEWINEAIKNKSV